MKNRHTVKTVGTRYGLLFRIDHCELCSGLDIFFPFSFSLSALLRFIFFLLHRVLWHIDVVVAHPFIIIMLIIRHLR